VLVVTNGTKVTWRWLKQHGAFVNIIAVLYNSFDERVNKAIRRYEPGREADNVAQLQRVTHEYRKLSIKFKLNTVINALNWREDMAQAVADLTSFR
jgi:hypothetical protein